MSTVRQVSDTCPGIDPHTVLPDHCCKPVGRDRLCCLPRGHKGACLPFTRWAQRDIGPDNPRWVPPRQGRAS